MYNIHFSHNSESTRQLKAYLAISMLGVDLYHTWKVRSNSILRQILKLTLGLWPLQIEQNIPSLIWTLPRFYGALKSSLSHCNFKYRIKHFSITFIPDDCSSLPLNTDQHPEHIFGSLCVKIRSLIQKLLTKTWVLYRFSGKHLLQCDVKKVFASLSKFVSESARQKLFSIMGWGKLLKSKFLMMSNKSIMAKSPSIVSFWPNCYSVTFWGSCEEVKLYNKTQSSCKWTFTILRQGFS